MTYLQAVPRALVEHGTVIWDAPICRMLDDYQHPEWLLAYLTSIIFSKRTKAISKGSASIH